MKKLAVGIGAALAALSVAGGGFLVLIMTVAAAAGGTQEAIENPDSCTPGQQLPADWSTPPTGWPDRPESTLAPAPNEDGSDPAIVPDSLEVPVGGGTVTLNARQLEVASQIVGTAREVGASDDAITIALMTALQESTLRNLANSNVPESLEYPNDGVGSDHDSVNPFQQRPAANWGSIEELMDVDYATRAFFGGTDGPNGGSPRGLFDIPGWEELSRGEAAQKVQVSAFPTAYDKWEEAAESILAAVGPGSGSGCGSQDNGEAVLPLDAQTYQVTSDYGPRDCYGAMSCWHPAWDFATGGCGAPVYAIRPGTVTTDAGPYLGITDPATGVEYEYLHIWPEDRLVGLGDVVDIGDHIGGMGDMPPSYGCHLDLRIDVSGTTDEAMAAFPTSKDAGAPPSVWGYVEPNDFMIEFYGLDLCPAEWCTVNRG
ncbi:M23 family metallopeptidase [Microbacterium paludicola]|uniref:M23 family metallopeptidase n=1 Tax=Microbacterium paludicola TaxID=300019 RepID=UPI0031D5CE1D